MKMNGISHKQAKRYILADLDGLLTEAQSLDLETHLRACETCRAESQEFATLTARLHTNFRSRWDIQDGPSQNVLTNIRTKSRRIIMQKRIDFAFNIFGGILTLLVLFFVVTSVISQFQKKVSTLNENQTNVPAASPTEERLIAFTSARDGNLDIYTMRADGSELTNLTNNPAGDMDPVWSPDGKRIAFLSDDRSGSGSLQIYSMNPDGTDLIRLTNTPDTEWWAGLDWSPDGQYLVAQHFPIESEQTTPGQGHTNIYLINANGSGTTQLTENESGGDHSPKWSPKGDLIAFLHTESNSNQIYTIRPDATGMFKLSDSERNDTAFNWSSDGSQIIYFSSPMNCFPPDTCPANEIWSVRADGTERITLLALPDSITPGATLDQVDWTPDRIDWSPDGTRLISVTWDSSPGSAGNSYLSILSPFNNSDTVHKKLPGLVTGTSWSPDGLFFTYGSDASGNWDIYTLSVTDVIQNPDAEPLQITSSPSGDTSPAWQPMISEDRTEAEPTPEPEKTASKDRLIAFTSRQSGNYEIYTVRSDGSDVRNITNHSASDVNPAWSPDGKRIAFQSDRNSGGYYSQIFLMDADGSNVVLLTTDKGEHMLPLNVDGKTNPWSPDGSKLLFLRRGLSEGEWILQSIDIKNGDITSLAPGRVSFSDISWSPDGKYIWFILNDPQNTDLGKFVSQIHIVSTDGTNLINISSLLPSDETLVLPYNYYWSRDGKSISFSTWIAPENITSENHISKLYEAGIDGSLTLRATARSPIAGVWDGIYFISPLGPGNWTWVYPDGSINTINPTKECEQERLYDVSINSYTSAVASFSRSPNGNGVIIASCPDGNVHLSWVNSTGTEVTPIAKLSTAPVVGYIDWVQWSQDDKFIAFHLIASEATDVHIVNITESLKDPSLPLVKIPLGKSEFPYQLPAWQQQP